MNLTLVGALGSLLGWFALVFLAHTESGAVNLLYAAGVVLLARRVMVGAGKFLS